MTAFFHRDENILFFMHSIISLCIKHIIFLWWRAQKETIFFGKPFSKGALKVFIEYIWVYEPDIHESNILSLIEETFIQIIVYMQTRNKKYRRWEVCNRWNMSRMRDHLYYLWHYKHPRCLFAIQHSLGGKNPSSHWTIK